MVIINGKKYEGNNVSISNGNIVIDGDLVGKTSEFEEKELIIQGNVNSITTASGDVTVNGNVTGNVSTMSGDIECGNIFGNVSTMSGDVTKK